VDANNTSQLPSFSTGLSNRINYAAVGQFKADISNCSGCLSRS
jgi:hypothetical protein